MVLRKCAGECEAKVIIVFARASESDGRQYSALLCTNAIPIEADCDKLIAEKKKKNT